jgi:uncharacterized protein (TIGR00266 family)
MARFEVIGEIDPFLLISLKKGEKVYCESNAMVAMDGSLELKGEMRGGFFKSLARIFASRESFFQQTIEAVDGDGEALLAPILPGDIKVLEIGERQYRFNDGTFLAATDGVDISIKPQSIGKALFGGTGGLFVMETSGEGTLALSGFGAVIEVEVKPDKELIVDNYHVVAWEKTLDYKLSITTTKRGFFSGLINSLKSGEGIVNRFRGEGRVLISSRNSANFLNWITSAIKVSNE